MGALRRPLPSGSASLRSTAASALHLYGQAVLAIADRLGPRAGIDTGPPQRPAGELTPATRPGGCDGRTADIVELRRLALDAVLGAADDPARGAAEHLARFTTNLSEWAAGRLVDEAERMRVLSLQVVVEAADPARQVSRRQFDTRMRGRFPWLGDADAARLYHHATLASYRAGRDVPAAPATPAPDPTGGRAGRLGALVSRLRSLS